MFSDPAQIELLVLDVDGVMTAGQVVLAETGRLTYHFDVQDGSALKYWHRHGGKTAIVTGRNSEAVTLRARELGIGWVYQSALKKIEAYRRCLAETGTAAERVCAVGDDLPDLPILVNSGYPIAVANAAAAVKQRAAYVTRRSGGHGAVREVVERLLRARGAWQPILDAYVGQTL